MGLELKLKDTFIDYFMTEITNIVHYIGYDSDERDSILIKYRDDVLFKICDKFDNSVTLKGYMLNIIKELNAIETTQKDVHDFETVAIAYADEEAQLFRMSDFIKFCKGLAEGAIFIPDIDAIPIESNKYYDVIEKTDDNISENTVEKCELDVILPKIRKYFTSMRATYPIDAEKAHRVLEDWLNNVIAVLFYEKRITKYTFDSIIEYAEFLDSCDYKDAEKFDVSLDMLDVLFSHTDSDSDLVKIKNLIKCYQDVYYGVSEKRGFKLGDLVKATITDKDIIAVITGRDETRYIVHPLARYGEWDSYVIEADCIKLVEFKNS